MDWTDLRDDWAEVRDDLHAQWPLLTRDDLDLVGGSRTYLVEVVSERYGQPEPQAQQQVDEVLRDVVRRRRPGR